MRKNIILISLALLFTTSGHSFQTLEFAKPNIHDAKNFIEIPAGSFIMGSPESEPNHFYDETTHEVSLTRNFEMQKTHVTQMQYFLVMGTSPSTFNKKEFCEVDFVQIKEYKFCPNHPVERVSWEDVQKFIQKINSAQKQYVYRLPTEAEWEYSARAKTQSAFWFGDDTNVISDHVWFGQNSNNQTQRVGLKSANPFGLYDISGQLWQWTNDWYGFYPQERVQDPTGYELGVQKVLRGGSFISNTADVRSAARTRLPIYGWGNDIGFRLVRMKK